MRNLIGVLLISAALIGAGVFLAYRSEARTDTRPESTAALARPSPIAAELPQAPVKIVPTGAKGGPKGGAAGEEASRARSADLKPEPAKVMAELGGSDWAVVAAIYNAYEPAERRAQSISGGSSFQARVFPGRGQGSKYMVVLGSGMTQSKALQLRDKAVSGGLPGDTYVTRLRASAE